MNPIFSTPQPSNSALRTVKIVLLGLVGCVVLIAAFAALGIAPDVLGVISEDFNPAPYFKLGVLLGIGALVRHAFTGSKSHSEKGGN